MYKWGYRPGLDGLRVLAVYLVVLFHAELTMFTNGYIGVDIFFVLSGFLVTNVLLSEYEKTNTIDLLNFYGKRMKRLLPAAITTIVFTTIFFWFFSSPILVQNFLDDAKAALLYYANFNQIALDNNYFASELSDSPFVHFWSLSIEEQFYFIFPVTLIGLLYLQKRLGYMKSLIILIFLTCISVYLQVIETDPVIAYFSTFTRIYQILAGATLAYFMFHSKWQPNYKPIKIVSITILFITLFSLNTSIPPKINGFIATILTLTILVNSHAMPKILENKGLVYLGKISYGIYLWHWPIIAYMLQKQSYDHLTIAFIAIVGSTLLASISYHTVETLFRFRTPFSSKTLIYGGLLLSVAFFQVGNMLQNSLNDNEYVLASQSTVGGINCNLQNLEGCLLSEGNSLNVLALGDSHSGMFRNIFVDWAKQNDYNLYQYALAGCSWQKGIYSNLIDNETREQCINFHKTGSDTLIEYVQPDILLLFSRDYSSHPSIRTEMVLEANESQIVETVSLSLDDYVNSGAKIIVIEPLPLQEGAFTPVICLSYGYNDCDFERTVSSTVERIREYSRFEPVETVDVSNLVCSELTCEANRNNIIVRRDGNHLTSDYLSFIQPSVVNLLNESH